MLKIPGPWLPLVCALSLAVTAACGGGGDDSSEPPDLDAIPSATLPAELPTVVPLGSGPIVTTGGANRYTIQSGDTFSDIAARFGITTDELIAANPGVDPTGLNAGDVINLPEAAAGNTPAPAPTDEPEEPTEPAAEATEPPAPTDTPVPPAGSPTQQSLGTTYIVVAGDFPQAIADKLGVTLDALVAANPGILDRNLQVGEVLIIPPAATPAQLITG
jgi:LysM repeat protein